MGVHTARLPVAADTERAIGGDWKCGAGGRDLVTTDGLCESRPLRELGTSGGSVRAQGLLGIPRSPVAARSRLARTQSEPSP